MAHVTIPDTAPRVQYTVGGTSTTNFTIPFAYFADSDIKVYVGSTLKTLSTDYTITGTAVDEGYSGGTVVLGTGVTNTTVTVIRDVPVKRITDFPTNGPFNITQLNTELDALTAQLQQEETGHDLFLRIAEYDTYTDLTLPVKADRAGTVLGFNATTGDPEAGPTIADVSTLAAITADIATLADIEDGTDATDAIQTVAGISGNVTTVAGISGNVTTVAGISADVTTVAGIDSDVTAVAADATDIGTVSANIASVNTVAGIDADVTTVAAISGDVTTVAGIDSDVSAVAAIDSDVTAVAADATDIGTVSSNIADVNTVAGISANVTTVAGISANVTSVAGNATNINTVAGIDSDVSTVAGIAADVTAVANNEVDVSQVAADIAKVIEVANDLQETVSEIDTVANNIADVNTVGTAIADVSAVAAIDSDVTTVSGISANVTTVAGVSANVTTVAGISANVTTVAGISANVTTVAGDSADIATVAGISADVSAVAAIDSDITTAAANVADITNFADVYIGASATAPTTRNDSSALQVGDLYFDTSTDTMKVYSSGGWTAAGSSVNGTANRYDYVVGTASGSYDGSSNTTFPATYDAGYVDVWLNGSKLVPTADFTATSGTQIVLASAASAGANVCIVGYGTFSLANFSVGDANDVSLAGVGNGDVLIYNSTSGDFEPGTIDSLPSQTGNSGKYLTTDGSAASWGTVDLSTKVSKTGDTMTGALAIQSATSSTSTDALDLRQPSNASGAGSEGLESRILIGGVTRYSKIVGTHNQYQDTLSSLEFYTSNTSGILKRMRIDGNGYVTMPYQPAFFVWDSAPADDYFSGNYFLGNASLVNTVNIGNHWNFSTGRFTAPVAGTYIFSLTFSTNDSNSHFVNIHKNGSLVGENVLQYSNAYTSASITAILQLAVGDYVQAARRGTGYSIYSAHFSGFLIG